ncbi:hypothetical protein [Marinospirillum minutulum]|uniref:hypothetical protein n=1 Tax=Marinospirillum minutulum TaxID=64974 RepID=UPI0004175510|nr:hypothetical protein [Marinospirillum minutulum]
MNRESSVNELIAESEELLAVIDGIYRNAEKTEDIVGVAKPKVKSCLEHLRSSLEYIAQDLSEFTGSSKTPRNVYFPYGKDKSIFTKSLNQNLPDLENKFRDKIESIQPYTCGDRWLIHLCKVTNDHKHDQLQEQTRINSPESMTMLGGGAAAVDGTGKIYMGSATINGIKMPEDYVLTADKAVSDLQQGHSVSVERKYEWVKFVIKGTDIDVLDLLKRSHSNIREFSRAIYE